MIKKIVGIGLALVMAFTSMPVYAQSIFDDGEDGQSPELAGEYLAQVMDYIENNYIGGDVSIEELVKSAIEGMANSLDEYTEYYTMEEYNEIMKSIAKEVYATGIDFQINEEGYPVVTSVEAESGAKKAGIRVNDKIISINGVNIKGFSNNEIKGALTRESKEDLTLITQRRKKINEDVVTLNVTPVKTVFVENDISKLIKIKNRHEKTDNVAYVNISAIGEGTSEELRVAIRALKRDKKEYVILDMRGNTGGYVEQAVEICKQLVPSGVIINTVDKNKEAVYYRSTLVEKPFTKIVVIVDGMTASASEIVVSALQDSGTALVVGQHTYGKGVMQSVTEFSDLGVLKMTVYEYFSRNGRKINGVGIAPNVEVEDVLFLSTSDQLESSKVRLALEILGFGERTNKKSLGKFQTYEGLPITYTLDEGSVNAINIKLYETMTTVDRSLLQAYLSVIS